VAAEHAGAAVGPAVALDRAPAPDPAAVRGRRRGPEAAPGQAAVHDPAAAHVPTWALVPAAGHVHRRIARRRSAQSAAVGDPMSARGRANCRPIGRSSTPAAHDQANSPAEIGRT
jgi:hypothetical protein